MGEGGSARIGNLISLWDVPGLRRMRNVCSKHRVHFTAIGSLVRNLIRIGPEWEHDPDYKMDVFDLVPFASDVDLLHSGPPELTPIIQRSLQHQIPFGECLRWQIRSFADNGIFWESLKVSNVVPAATMTFSTDSTFGVRDRWNGAADFEARQFRYIRNAYYDESPLFRAGRDLEVCSVLMYMRILFEAGLKPHEIVTQPGWAVARQVIDDTCATNDALIVLQERSKLRARMRYLAAALRGSMSGDDVTALYELGLLKLMDYLQGTLDLDEILSSPGVLTISANLGGDMFRLPWNVAPWVNKPQSETILERLLARVSVERDESLVESETDKARLGPGQECLMTSSAPERLQVGRSASSRNPLGDINEFLHFAVPVDSIHLSSWKRKYGSKGLSVLVAFELDALGEGEVLILPVPSAFSFGKDRLLIRVNCGGLLELSRFKITGDFDGTIDAWFIVLGWSGVWN